MTTRASSSLRRIELALWALGLALLGAALTHTWARWRYQAQQERILFSATRPVNLPIPPPVKTAPAPLPLPVPVPAAVPEKPKVAAAPRETVEKPAPKPQPAADPSALGRIEIPRLRLKAIVREGADEETLARAVGLVPGAAHPGETGNVVLAGHRDTFFRPLRNIRVDDEIRLVVPPHEYRYRVDSIRVVAPDETSVLQSKGIEELTLVTCFPFRFIGPAPDRFIVSAKRVQ